MFENIKLLLGLTDDTSKDNIIKYHINAVTKRILAYCKLELLPSELEDIVEEIVVKRVKGVNDIRRERIGDYEKEYVVYESAKNELKPYEPVLKVYQSKKVKFV